MEALEAIDRAWRHYEAARFAASAADQERSKGELGQAVRLLTSALGHAAVLDTSTKTYLTSVCQAVLAYREQGVSDLSTTVMWLGLKLNGDVYPPEHAGPSSLFFAEYERAALPELMLSSVQLQQLGAWALLRSLYPKQDWNSCQIDLSQDALTNCSFVALLISVVNNPGSRVVEAIEPRRPSLHYYVALTFNGCRRLVQVDDRVPMLQDHTVLLTVRLHSHPTAIWPMVLEKAFLTVMGHGYDFPGSNMCTDTHMLTGWHPQIVVIENGKLEQWDRVYPAFLRHQVYVGVGTGKLSASTCSALGLVLEHDYAVVAMKEENGQRLLLVRNPWGESLGEAGGDGMRPRMQRDSWVPELQLQHFRRMYLNWDPQAFFPLQQLLGFLFPKNPLGEVPPWPLVPQFSVANEGLETVLVVLLVEKFMSGPLPLVLPDNSLLSLLVYRLQGERQLHRHGDYIVKGFQSLRSRFKNAQFTLPPNGRCTVAIPSTFAGAASLTVRLLAPVAFSRVKHRFLHTSELAGRWDVFSAGGSWAHLLYVCNPQYLLEVPVDTVADIGVYVGKAVFVNCHVFAVRERGCVRSYSTKAAVVDDKYALYLQVLVGIPLAAGHYTIVVSTFEPGMELPYTLMVSARDEVRVSRAPPLVGMFMARKRVEFVSRKAVVEVAVPRTTLLVVRATGTFHSRLQVVVATHVSSATPVESPYGAFCNVPSIPPGRHSVVVIRDDDTPAADVEIGSDVSISIT